MEIKKAENREPKYPATEVAKKVGAAVAAAGLLAGLMTGCRSVVQIDGDVAYVPEKEALMGATEDFEVCGSETEENTVSCTDAGCADTPV